MAVFGEVWSAPATEAFIALVEQFGGMLLITASTVGPESEASVDVLADVLQAWDSMTRWVLLEPGAPG